jgi:hypothetical protein
VVGGERIFQLGNATTTDSALVQELALIRKEMNYRLLLQYVHQDVLENSHIN